MVSVAVQAVLAVACGLLTNFFVVVALYLLYGVAIGLAMPVKQAYLNAHIPSAQRATIISLDSMFASSGGVLGPDRVGLGRAHALDRHGVGVERGDAAARDSVVLEGAHPRPRAGQTRLDAQTHSGKQV